MCEYKPQKTKCKCGNLFMKVLNALILICFQHLSGFLNKSPAPGASSYVHCCEHLPLLQLKAEFMGQSGHKDSTGNGLSLLI